MEKQNASGSDAYNFVSAGSGAAIVQVVCLSGRSTSAAATVATSSSTASNATPFSVGLTGVTAAANDDLIWFAALDQVVQADTWGFSTVTSFTKRQDVASGNWTTATTQTQDAVSAGATGTLSSTATRATGTGAAGWGGFVVAVPVAAGAAAYIPPPASQQAPTSYRSPAMPQLIVAGIAAFLAVAPGPTIPQGGAAQLPLVRASWPYLAAQPVEWTPIVTASARVAPLIVPQIMQGAWPYVPTMLPEPTASAFSITGALVAPNVTPAPVARPWPYTVVQSADTMPILSAAAQVSPTAVVLSPVQATWPYAASQQLPVESAPLVPNQGTQIPPAVTLQWSTQPWPYAATLLFAPAVNQPAPNLYTLTPTINPPRASDWPYVATMLPEPASSAFGQLAGTPAPNLVPVQFVAAWPYVFTQPADTTPIIAAGSQILPPVVTQITPSAWPYAAMQFLADSAILAPSLGVQIPPQPVRQWLTYQRWPHEKAIAPAPTSLAWAPFIAAFIAGNDQTWLVSGSQRFVLANALNRVAQVARMARDSLTDEH